MADHMETLEKIYQKFYPQDQQPSRLRGNMKTIYPFVFNKPEVKKKLGRLHDHYELVTADKAGKAGSVFVCKTHHINCVLEELGFNSTRGNLTYTHISLSNEELL